MKVRQGTDAFERIKSVGINRQIHQAVKVENEIYRVSILGKMRACVPLLPLLIVPHSGVYPFQKLVTSWTALLLVTWQPG
jgi:hypothetical protein